MKIEKRETIYITHSENDVLSAMRNFLEDIYEQADDKGKIYKLALQIGDSLDELDGYIE